LALFPSFVRYVADTKYFKSIGFVSHFSRSPSAATVDFRFWQ